MIACFPLRRVAAVLALVALSACAADPQSSSDAAAAGPAPDYAAIVQAQDRTEADRATDQRLQPEKLLAFYGVRAGMHVLDMGASAGYNAELLARAVGDDGIVYAQNSPDMLENVVKGRLAERMKRGTMGNVVPLARPFDDPVPADMHNLDLVTFNFVYHDTVHLGVDRAKMNRAIFNALKSGGVYIVADHSAKAGAGTDVTKTLHRIEESVIRREVEAAGFRYAGSADFLRNADDPRDAMVFKNPVRNDEFVLKFVKP
jgi:predicted methyltransferase